MVDRPHRERDGGLEVGHHRAIRTTNFLERLFLKERRRLEIVLNAFGEKDVLKLIFAVVTRAAERWRAIKVTEFERHLLAAVRQQLDELYEAEKGVEISSTREAFPSEQSSKSET